jgi:hypothetical protein
MERLDFSGTYRIEGATTGACEAPQNLKISGFRPFNEVGESVPV